MARSPLLWGIALLASGCVSGEVTEAELTHRLVYFVDDSADYLEEPDLQPPAAGTSDGAPVHPLLHPEQRPWLPTEQPDLHGTVVLRRGDRLAVRLQETPPDTWNGLIRMAIFTGRHYKGEFLVREFYKGHAIGKLDFHARGQHVVVGDCAACKVE